MLLDQLDRRVADAGALHGDQLDHRGVQRVRRVHRCRAPLDVVHLGALVGNDERALELPHALGVDPEVGLQRDRHFGVLGHVDERAARPHRAVERRELVVGGGDHGGEVLADEVLVLAQPGVHVEEDHALLGELLLHRVVDHLGLVLRGDPGEELALRLRDAEPIERALDVLGDVLPARLLLLRGADVVGDVVEVDLGEHRGVAPRRHRLREEDVERLVAELAHPLRLFLQARDRLHHLVREPLGRAHEVLLWVVEAVALAVVGPDVGDLRCRGHHTPPAAAAGSSQS